MTIRRFAGLGILLLSFTTADALDVERDDVAAFIDKLVSEHAFDRAALSATLAQAETKQSILDAIARPAERVLTWGEYRRIFLTDKRIDAGVEFWQEHCAELERISEESGVPIEIIVGIIGVETYFGRITGGHRVLDALSTLAFDYPPRARFFRRELEQFLLLVREEDLEATEPSGSYAGAMGRPQFMPSSYRAYAVDATGDGKRDIWNDWSDVAGSIANYMTRHGWRADEPVVAQAGLGQGFEGPVPENTLKPRATVASLSERGILFSTELPADSVADLITLEGEDGTEHWVGFHNFFVITRYNRSVMYALAVHQLGQEIALGVLNAGT
ncbi:MAG: lytic murein transglycosylase B [Woeseiaceae bacterium]|nr:lytic murein transglycosylase B [Woeseiaceae bacterium]